MTKKEQLQDMLTPDNWDELEFYVTAAAHNEHGPDREITDQFYEDAINEIVQENRIMLQIMREDHRRYIKLRSEIEKLEKKLADIEQENYDRMAEKPQ